MLWSDPNKKGDSILVVLQEKLFKKNQYVDRKIKESPFYDLFEKKGLFRSDLEILKSKPEWTDINTSPVALSMVVIFIGSLFYFIIECYFTLSEYYEAAPPYTWFILAGVFTVPLVFYILKNSKLKPKEIAIMSVLVGFGISMVSYPIILRINQWTDNDGLQTYTYILKEDGRWTHSSVIMQIPNLIFDLKYSDYWNQFEINASKEFELRNGGLGFYQINMEPIYADQRMYYEGKQKDLKTAHK